MSDLQVTMETRAGWRAWLAEHHDTSPGVWLVRWKKGSGRPLLTYDELVEEALCFGWVDSQPRSLDAARSQVRVTPRKPGSNWSGANKARVDRLLESRMMRPSGLAAVERAKADGSWTALDDVERLIEPDDLHRLLDADQPARAEWKAFPGRHDGQSSNGSATPRPTPPGNAGSNASSPMRMTASAATNGANLKDLEREPADLAGVSSSRRPSPDPVGDRW